jgi:16S rRNA (cytosine1402-N4)-methyltransferase
MKILKTRENADAPGSGYHAPVLPTEVVGALRACAGKRFVDCTLGGGGHTQLLLEAGASVIGVTRILRRSPDARQRIAGNGAFEGRFEAFHSSFGNAPDLLSRLGVTEVDGFLLGSGRPPISSTRPNVGFPFRGRARWTVRMNPWRLW